MRIYGRVAIAFAIAGMNVAGASMVSCSGGDDASSASDASIDVEQHHDAAPIDDDATAPNLCAPELQPNYAPTWAPPATTNTACSPAQVQGYFDACLASGATKATCDTYEGVPANSPCIACMFSRQGDSTYGAVVQLTNGTTLANIPGCIALTDGDLSATGCGAKTEAARLCNSDACEGCVIDSTSDSFTAFTACENDASATLCSKYATAATCSKDAKYAHCTFANFESYAVGIGDFMCAGGYDGGTADAGDGG